MKHSKFRLLHYLLQGLGIFLWLAAFVSVVFAWIAGIGFFWVMMYQEWMSNAIALGILALGVKTGVIIMSLKNSCCGKRKNDSGGNGCCGGNCNCDKA